MNRQQEKAMFANKKLKLEGKWFKGNVFSMPLDKFLATKKYGKDVMHPQALRTKTVGKTDYSQYYHKPIQIGEFWD